ncbi:hypothetical protein RclHR1_17740004 [Rhizophagus clarus]|uniref:Uncharacterized protein n=1 Tax=Rhizophagus clarus TaxID=94130 RepID=A0A2Z6QZG0_9GLOM|nr:hypothetical protein RclHR1_17740004 [Rhizophagus clarus]
MYRQVGRNTAVNREIMDMDTYATTNIQDGRGYEKTRNSDKYTNRISANRLHMYLPQKTLSERKGSHINECVDNRTKEPIKDYKDDVVVVNEHEDSENQHDTKLKDVPT